MMNEFVFFLGSSRNVSFIEPKTIPEVGLPFDFPFPSLSIRGSDPIFRQQTRTSSLSLLLDMNPLLSSSSSSSTQARYLRLHARWASKLLEALSSRGLNAGDADISLTCSLCGYDWRRAQPR